MHSLYILTLSKDLKQEDLKMPTKTIQKFGTKRVFIKHNNARVAWYYTDSEWHLYNIAINIYIPNATGKINILVSRKSGLMNIDEEHHCIETDLYGREFASLKSAIKFFRNHEEELYRGDFDGKRS
jgi:hypothetical protein